VGGNEIYRSKTAVSLPLTRWNRKRREDMQIGDYGVWTETAKKHKGNGGREKKLFMN
jgi:hypothetical protein